MTSLVCGWLGHAFPFEWRYRPGPVEATWFRACVRCGEVRAIPFRDRGFQAPLRFVPRPGPFSFMYGFRPAISATGTVADVQRQMKASGEVR